MFVLFWHRPMVSHTRDLCDSPGAFYPCQARPQRAEGSMPERMSEHELSYVNWDGMDWVRA